MSVDVAQFDMAAPDDLSALADALRGRDVAAIRRLALLVRVAGEYTDGSREKARGAIEAFLAERSLSGRSLFVTVVGTEGATTPGGYAMIDEGGAREPGAPQRLAIGLARRPPPADKDVGTIAHAVAVKSVVDAAIVDGGLTPAGVETIIVNVPLPDVDTAGARARKGRAAAALGAGFAIGEIVQTALKDDVIGADDRLYARRVQTFTGPSIRDVEVIAIGNAAGAGGDLFACNVITQDLLDARPLKRMLVGAGLTLDRDGELDTTPLVATIAKAGVHPSGFVSGSPTTIFGSATSPEKHARAALSGVLGATLHTTRTFSTFDPIQQAPLGGGTICCIVRDVSK